MIIACDVDDVLNNLMDVTIELYNYKYGTDYDVSNVTAYNLENCFDEETAKNMRAIFESTTDSIWKKVKPVKGSQEALEKLLLEGHSVYLATHNCPATYGDKVAWIKRFYPFIDESRIICIKDKWMLRSDVMIEDSWQNLLAKPYYHRVLMDQPWNQSTKDDVYGVYRCSNWKDIVNVINKINEEECLN